MATNTLTSLAILRANVDKGRDYLDYLRPFILQVLSSDDVDLIKTDVVCHSLRGQFGLEIPARTVEVVLKRIAKHYPIKRDHHVYRKTGEIPDPQLLPRQTEAERHIGSILNGLKEFSSTTPNPIDSTERAVTAVCAFLSEFDVTCLRAYLRGTAIPPLDGAHEIDIALVSQYIRHVQESSPERFDSFLVLVQGHMLANALMCPDLQNSSQTYKKVTFYFDTPLLLHALGLEGRAKETASRELIELLHRLGSRVAAFSHSCHELRGVLQAVATNLDSPNARGIMVHEARKGNVTKSDLLLLVRSIEDRLEEIGIEIENTPRYTEAFQIDETIFEQTLNDEVSYQNPRAREHDVNSVRSIYVLRANKPAPSLEKARAVFVTSNASFARAAWDYGQRHESSYDVSSVISAFSLANIAWLKAPMGAPSIPRTQMLAIAYAALQPSLQLLNRFMAEIDRLEAQGRISERDHQILRSSTVAQDELMHLTLGEDAAFNEETVAQTLERVYSEIKKEESEKVIMEQRQHEKTQDALIEQRARNEMILRNSYWRCHGRANAVAWLSSVIIATALVIALLVGPLVGFGWESWVFRVCTIILLALTLMSLLFGSNVKHAHQWVQGQCLTWLLKRESKAIGIGLHEWDDVST